jgi:hypothetical protein
MAKKLILLTFSIAFLTILPRVFAVPTLQLNIPGATYYETNPWFPDSEDSWVTTSNPFELWVAGATSPNWVEYIYDVKLHIALIIATCYYSRYRTKSL